MLVGGHRDPTSGPVEASSYDPLSDTYWELDLKIRNVHVITSRLDPTRFQEALSKTVDLYPHVAGQLRCNSGEWDVSDGSSSFFPGAYSHEHIQILLAGLVIPVDIVFSDHIGLCGWVVQDRGDLEQFWSSALVDGPLAALLRIKLTICEDGYTAIGVSWHHTLGLS